MKKITLIIYLSLSGFLYSNPMWTIYDIRVENPEAAANVIAATDELMASNFAKENFNGSLHLNAYIANGDNEATHFFAVLQPSLTEHMAWISASQQSKEGQKFFNTLRKNSSSVSQRFNSFIQTYGTPSNDDTYWIIHEFYAEPSDMEQFLKLTQKLDDDTRDSFPGQFGVSQVMFGGNPEVSHLLTVGYSSIAELEGWEDQVATNPALQKYFKMADRIVDWKGSKLLFNARIYDSASDLEQFVTKDYE